MVIIANSGISKNQFLKYIFLCVVSLVCVLGVSHLDDILPALKSLKQTIH